MPTSLKQFWLIVSAVFIGIFLILAVAIWQPSFSLFSKSASPLSDPGIDDSAVSEANSSNAASSNVIPDEVDPSFPAPAKKLHTVLTDPEYQPSSDEDLDRRTAELNKKIEALNVMLKESGLLLPEPDENTIATVETNVNNSASNTVSNADSQTGDTAERLNAIKEYMEKREVN